MKIGLITTKETNIGDDFIRTGIVRLLQEAFVGKPVEFVCVNKHKPYMVYPVWHPARLGDTAERLPIGGRVLKSTAGNVFTRLGLSRFDGCDMIVQCGAPVFWPNCSHSEWARPLWHDVVGRLCDRIPVLNLAAGSCYPWERQHGIQHSPEDNEFIKKILGYCCLSTVRDRLAQSICMSLGRDTPLIPCSAFLAGAGHKSDLARSDYILINYMQGGGHYEWGQRIDAGRWQATVKSLIARLGKRHKLAFLCHDEKECLLANGFDANLPIFFPKTLEQYFDYVAAAKFGLCNRMHASVGMAGLGRPSIAIGTDTRLLMVEELGLPIHFVNDVNVAILEEETENLLKVASAERERLLALQSATRSEYLVVIEKALSCR